MFPANWGWRLRCAIWKRYRRVLPAISFTVQFLGAQLMEEAGMEKAGAAAVPDLLRLGLQMMVAEWEPSLLEHIENRFTAEQ